MFKFRKIAAADFPLMLKWLSRDHVKEWWDDADDTLEKVARHYGNEDKEVERFILVETNENTEKPIGYFQYYFVDEDSIGIDQFIGEENYLNRGIGEKTIKLFIELIMQNYLPKTIILDPSPENKRAIKCYEKVGFRYYETQAVSNGEGLAYMMRFETNKLNK